MAEWVKRGQFTAWRYAFGKALGSECGVPPELARTLDTLTPMRVITWNLGAAFGPYVERHDEAWRHLESLEPDVALLQECIPAAWALRRWTVIKAPFSFWTTGLAVPAWKATEIAIPADNILARFPGFVAAADVDMPDGGPMLVVSVHSSAHPASAKTLRGLDAEALRRPSVPEPWRNDLFFAGAVTAATLGSARVDAAPAETGLSDHAPVIVESVTHEASP